MIQTSEALINRCAALRAESSRTGHDLSQKIHDAARWVATTALTLGLELVAGDGIFEGVADLDLHRLRRT